MQRRTFVSSLAACLAYWPSTSLGLAALMPSTAHANDGQGSLGLRDIVLAKATALSRDRFERRDDPLPDAFREIGYDAYRRIEFQNQRGLWRDGTSGFEVQPLHRGFIYSDRMTLNVVEDGIVRPLAYDPSLYHFIGMDPPGAQVGDIGYSGVRLLGSIGGSGVAQEFYVFQGASYFRALAAGTIYGLSSRGLAIRTGDPEGEEFPAFTELWIERPPPNSPTIVVHALLDGPSLTGAFMFTIRTGAVGAAKPPLETRVGVNAAIFPRVVLDHVGIAPLTTMYWYGTLERHDVDDYRARVHDSDGLSMCAEDGEWQWRPLANPKRLQTSSFDPGQGGKVRGFGLVQRARAWRDFQDIGADYHRRPSCWIAPHADWPEGRVELIEIPTNNEFNDNVVAYWRPSEGLRAGDRLDYGYDMVWSGRPALGFGLLKAVSSHSGAYAGTWRQIVIDFARQDTHDDLSDGGNAIDPYGFDPVVSAAGGRIHDIALIAHPFIDGLRLSFMLEPEEKLAEIRAVIWQNSRPISEIWLYRWTAS